MNQTDLATEVTGLSWEFWNKRCGEKTRGMINQSSVEQGVSICVHYFRSDGFRILVDRMWREMVRLN